MIVMYSVQPTKYIKPQKYFKRVLITGLAETGYGLHVDLVVRLMIVELECGLIARHTDFWPNGGPSITSPFTVFI